MAGFNPITEDRNFHFWQWVRFIQTELLGRGRLTVNSEVDMV
jgi:hypothetical protein